MRRVLASVLVFVLTVFNLGTTVVSISAQEVKGMNFFVSVDGDDSNDGSINLPFRTLEAARDAIRKLGNKSEGVTVNIRGGVYNFEESFSLGSEDSGVSQKALITYRGYEDEEVIFTGGTQIPADMFKSVMEDEKMYGRTFEMTEHTSSQAIEYTTNHTTNQAIEYTTARAIMLNEELSVLDRLDEAVHDKVLVADLKELGMTNYGNIYKSGHSWDVLPAPPILSVDGESQVLARWPNGNEFATTGTIKRQGFIPRDHEPDKDEGCDGHPPMEEWIDQDGPIFEAKIDDKRAHLWSQEKEPWFYGYWVWDWAFDTFSVVENGITRENGKWFIEADSPSRYGAVSNARYYAFNMLSELDSPGEWYLDREIGKLYFMPPAGGIEGREVLLATLSDEYIVINNAENINIENIRFTNSAGDGIAIKDSHNIKVAGSKFSDMSGKAVGITGGSNCGVQSNDITRMGAGGVTVHGGDRISLAPAGHYVDNNEISDYAMIVRTYTPAIDLQGVGNRATNNLIYDAPHMGIQFSGNDLLIENNEIYNVCYETDDAGAIYSMRDWTKRGNVINNNYLHDIYGNGGGHGISGIYLDDCLSSAEMTNNLFKNVAGRVLLLGGGRDNVFKDNIIINDGFATGMHLDDRGMGWANIQTQGPNGSIYSGFKNIYDELQKPENSESKAKWIEKYPTLMEAAPQEGNSNIILDQNSEQMGQPSGNEFENNILVGVSAEHSITKAGMDRGKYENNHRFPIGTDIGFSNPDVGDFDFVNKNIITDLVPDFKGINISDVALYSDEYRIVKKTNVGDVTLVSPEDGAGDLDIYNIILGWKKATNASLYSVVIGKDNLFSDVVKRISTDKTSIQVTGLEPEQEYFWEIIASDGIANGGRSTSDVYSFVTAPKEFSMNFGFEDANEIDQWEIKSGAPIISAQEKRSGESSLLIGSAENKEFISKSLGAPEYGKVEMWFFDGMKGTGANSAMVGNVALEEDWMAIGTNGSTDEKHYVTRVGSKWEKTNFERSKGWHKLTWDYTSGQYCELLIDDEVVKTIHTTKGFEKIEIGDMWPNDTAQNAYYFDDVSIKLLQPNLDPESIVLNATEIDILQGESYQLKAYITPATADQTIVWSTNENNIATVTQGGLVTGDKSGGIATITATSSNGEIVEECIVTVRELGKAELKGTIEQANTLLAKDYTAISYAELGRIISEATAIYNKDKASKEEIIKITSNLKKAMVDMVSAYKSVYEDGFENGFGAKWKPDSGITEEGNIVSMIGHGGEEGNSFLIPKGTKTGFSLLANLNDSPKNYKASFWLYDEAPTPNVVQAVAVARVSREGSYETIGIDYRSPLGYAAPGWGASKVKRSEGWHLFEIDATENGEMTFYVDGIKTNTKEVNSNSLTELRFMVSWLPGNTPNNIYIDDVSVGLEKPELNVGDFNNLIDQALALKEADYTSNEWKLLQSVIKSSRELAFDVDLTQEKVDTQFEMLEVAMTKQPLQLQDIIRVEEFVDKTVGYGTGFNQLDLPSAVEVELEDNSFVSLDVEWIADNYDGNTAGTYTLLGNLILTEEVANSNDLQATVKITVKRKASDSSDDSTSGDTSADKPSTNTGVERKLKISLTPNTDGNYKVIIGEKELETAFANTKELIIQTEKMEGAKKYTIELPSKFVTSKEAGQKIRLQTSLGTIDIPANMFEENKLKAKGSISFSIELEKDVMVSFDYMPTSQELKDPEHIMVLSIDENGNMTPIFNSKYDVKTQQITFKANEFGKYTIGFVKKTFSDIQDYTWAKKSIEVMASKGIINGTSAETYSPKNHITRADLVSLIVNVLGIEMEFESNFEDVRPSDYYYQTVGTGKALGLISGTGENVFNPKEFISRQDMMIMITRALRLVGKINTNGNETGITDFNDYQEISDYAIKDVSALVKDGIINGSNNRIYPKEKTTRAEAAAIIYKLYNKVN